MNTASRIVVGVDGFEAVGQYCVHHAPCPVVIMRGKVGTHA
jgi:nucleotide-binding universal stress UspA family protein